MSRQRRGFTLIELLIVVSLIGILTSIAIPSTQEALASARAAALFKRATAVRDALAGTDWRSNPGRWQSMRPGSTPRLLIPALGERFFHGEAGVELALAYSTITSRGVTTYELNLDLVSTNDAGGRALAKLNRMARGWRPVLLTTAAKKLMLSFNITS